MSRSARAAAPLIGGTDRQRVPEGREQAANPAHQQEDEAARRPGASVLPPQDSPGPFTRPRACSILEDELSRKPRTCGGSAAGRSRFHEPIVSRCRAAGDGRPRGGLRRTHAQGVTSMLPAWKISTTRSGPSICFTPGTSTRSSTSRPASVYHEAMPRLADHQRRRDEERTPSSTAWKCPVSVRATSSSSSERRCAAAPRRARQTEIPEGYEVHLQRAAGAHRVRSQAPPHNYARPRGRSRKASRLRALKNGVLTVTLPKADTLPRQIAIKAFSLLERAVVGPIDPSSTSRRGSS